MCQEDFFTRGDLEAVLEAIYRGIWDADDEFTTEVDGLTL